MAHFSPFSFMLCQILSIEWETILSRVWLGVYWGEGTTLHQWTLSTFNTFWAMLALCSGQVGSFSQHTPLGGGGEGGWCCPASAPDVCIRVWEDLV